MLAADHNFRLHPSRHTAGILAFSAALLAVACALPPCSHAQGPARPAGPPREKKHEIRHEIDQLEDKWRKAVLTGDTVAMDSLLADDYMAITSSGTLQTKAQTLDNLRSGKTHFTQLDISDRKVRFYGTTALVTSYADVQGATPEGPIQGSLRYTRVYVKQPTGAWKIVSFEASSVREPGEHK
jgi:ketosteroid isomerase-like protein